MESDTDPRHTFGVERRELARWRGLLEKLRASDGPVYGGGTFVRPGISDGGGGEGWGGGGEGGGADSAPPTMEQQQMMIKEQDLIIGNIGQGIDRLHDRAISIKEESTLHVKLLDGIDTDVDHAMDELRSETARATAVRQSSSNCPYYVTIVVLMGILALLLVLSM